MSEVMSQFDVAERFREYDGVSDVATVGEYLRVVERPESPPCSCFGPTEGRDITGWHVVEINWQQQSFLLAPCNHLSESNTDKAEGDE